MSETAENTGKPMPNWSDIFVLDCLFFLISFLFWYYEVQQYSWRAEVGRWSQRSYSSKFMDLRNAPQFGSQPHHLTSSVAWATYIISPSLSVSITKTCTPWSRIVVPNIETMHINLWAYLGPQQLIVFLSCPTNARCPWTNLRLLFEYNIGSATSTPQLRLTYMPTGSPSVLVRVQVRPIPVGRGRQLWRHLLKGESMCFRHYVCQKWQQLPWIDCKLVLAKVQYEIPNTWRK